MRRRPLGYRDPCNQRPQTQHRQQDAAPHSLTPRAGHPQQRRNDDRDHEGDARDPGERGCRRARADRGRRRQRRSPEHPRGQQRTAEHDRDHQRLGHHQTVVDDDVHGHDEPEGADERDRGRACDAPDQEPGQDDVDAEQESVEHSRHADQPTAEPGEHREHDRVQRRVVGERELAVEGHGLRWRVRVEGQVERRGEAAPVRTGCARCPGTRSSRRRTPGCRG